MPPKKARRLGHGYIGTEHLLLALFEALFEPVESVAPQVPAEAGITRSVAEEQIVTPPGEAPAGSAASDPSRPAPATRGADDSRALTISAPGASALARSFDEVFTPDVELAGGGDRPSPYV